MHYGNRFNACQSRGPRAPIDAGQGPTLTVADEDAACQAYQCGVAITGTFHGRYQAAGPQWRDVTLSVMYALPTRTCTVACQWLRMRLASTLPSLAATAPAVAWAIATARSSGVFGASK